MPRSFVTGTDKVTLGLGGTGIVPPITCAAIVKRANDTDAIAFFRTGSSGASRHSFSIRNSAPIGQLSYGDGTVTANAPTINVIAADGIVLLSVSKAAGSAIPRMHRYKYSTNTWTHENYGGAGFAAQVAPTGTAFIGESPSTGSGIIFVSAFWNRVLTDAEVESLPYSLMSWYHLNPVGGPWVLDQALSTTKIIDPSGNGANETALSGTTVSDEPSPFSYDRPTISIEAQPIVTSVGDSGGLLLLGAG